METAFQGWSCLPRPFNHTTGPQGAVGAPGKTWELGTGAVWVGLGQARELEQERYGRLENSLADLRMSLQSGNERSWMWSSGRRELGSAGRFWLWALLFRTLWLFWLAVLANGPKIRKPSEKTIPYPGRRWQNIPLPLFFSLLFLFSSSTSLPIFPFLTGFLLH